MTPAGRYIETRGALEKIVRFVAPRMLAIDLDGYIEQTLKLRERARRVLPADAGIVHDHVMGTVYDYLDLAIACRAFQRALATLYPQNETTFGPHGTLGPDVPGRHA